MPEQTLIANLVQPEPADDLYPAGWFSHAECELLAEWARDKLVLELGTFLGRSTVAMARTARHVVTVDWFKGSKGENWYDGTDTLARCRENLRAYGVEQNVTIVVGDHVRLEALHCLKDFDLAFVDGAHDSLQVRESSWLAIGAVGGDKRRLLWDDYSEHWPMVVAYVDWLAAATSLRVERLSGSKLARLA